FMEAGENALQDYELMELMLFRAIPRRDVKPLAKAIIERFGSFAEALAARPERLREISGLPEGAIVDLKVAEAAGRRLARGALEKRKVLTSFSAVTEYCRTAMAYAEREQFRVLFLDKRNALIADEVQGVGTVDHTPVYPREVVRRALELGASALILAHNHPSGDPTPSAADISMTREIVTIAQPFGIAVHDHLIVGRNGQTSFRGLKLI
ncbi:MAG: DNA repair protein RadC, partial [Anaeromyxobacteraceae bacterium]